MKKTFLFPTCFRKIGWIISIVTLLYFVIGVIFFEAKYDFNFKMPAIVGYGEIPFFSEETKYFVLAHTSFITTLFPVLMIIGLVFIAFSRERNEDEYVSKIRERALVWSVLATCAVLILANLLIYGLDALYVFWFDFLFFLLLFVIKFRIDIFRFNRSAKKDEE
ncbi:MAG: hypothetical protein H6Q16_620 [Bacteroidetes bacterium]|nr:hypothetical protein [Bacteroidota bacterium]